MKTFILTILLPFLCTGVIARPAFEDQTIMVNGFDHKVYGNDFIYHSSIPFVKESMLIRATDGNSSMEWKTEPAPSNLTVDSLSFVWLAGIGSSPGNASFDLFVNNEKKFTFWSDGSDEWSLNADDGSSLEFKKDLTDEHNDRFGFMYLTVPAAILIPGEPLNLKVTGGRFGKNSWYMTFKFPLRNGLELKALPAVIERNGKQHQLGIAGLLNFGQPDVAKIFIDGQLVKETNVDFGYNYVQVELPRVEKSTTANYRLELGGQIWEGRLTLNPVREWRVNFVQHTHTDIGYTRSQTEILAEHLRFIDYALDYCDLTDDYPDEAKFRWTCEASWAVDEYLKSRPAQQVERLLRRVREGRIEITGMYFNFNELPDEQTLAASLQPIKRFRELGLEVSTAMQNDVNGIGWCLNDFYSDLGIKYLNMGTHGHRALICFDKPTLFWWESPSGKRMLAYRGEHYMIGNTVFRIHTGDFNRFTEELLMYLADLEAKGYAYDLISIQHSGYLTDNSPPSTHASDMIRQWNEQFMWPKLKTATATEFFQEMEFSYGDSFQVIRGAWPDWWTDGFGGSAREVAAIRTAQNDLMTNAAGLTMAILQGATLPGKVSDRIEAINSALLFYTEHTVGYHASVSEPFHKNTMEQRALKESYAWEAARRAKMLGEESMGLLQNYIAREEAPSLVVYNTLNWNRSGLLTVYIDHQIIPRYTSFSIVDKNGTEAKAQPVEHHSDGTYWAVWVDDVPAFGFRKFVINVEKESPAQPQVINKDERNEMGNRWYKITIDNNRGAITSIIDKELNLELVDPYGEWKFGEFIYELLDNRAQMESFKLDNYHREPLEKVWFDGFIPGDVWDAIRFKGNTRAANRDGAYEFEVRLFNTAKRIDLAYAIEKKMVTDPEGIYIAFPLHLEDGLLAFDVQGGEIRAGIDQIPGSANDWNTVQNYARLSNSGAQILLSSPEVPLMQFGAINTGRYEAGATPESTHIYGWPMNNYWVTNFNAEQRGGHTWTYNVTSHRGNSIENAARFGWGNRTPFLVRVLPGGGNGDEAWHGSLISGWPDNLLLVSAIPDEDGRSSVFHVREIAGKKAGFALRNGVTGVELKLAPVDVTGNPLENSGTDLQPFETKFFRIYF
jgi:alpha-mannosidase